jgi:putative SOS response-associated peptidase YedK
MPVILQDDQIDAWLGPAISDPRQLGELLKPPLKVFPDCYPVSRKVNP